jgi:transposase, IS5 family
MRPKKPKTTAEGDLFRARLDQIINLKHELVQLGEREDRLALDRSRDRAALQRQRPARD